MRSPTYFALYWLGSLHFWTATQILNREYQRWHAERATTLLTRRKQRPLHSRHLPHQTHTQHSITLCVEARYYDPGRRRRMRRRRKRGSWEELWRTFIVHRKGGTVLPWTWTETKDSMICLQKWPRGQRIHQFSCPWHCLKKMIDLKRQSEDIMQFIAVWVNKTHKQYHETWDMYTTWLNTVESYTWELNIFICSMWS